MPVFIQQGLIFIHIPKTGGESVSDAIGKATSSDQSGSPDPRTGTTKGLVKQWLGRKNLDLVRKGKHATARQISELIGTKEFNSAFKFSIVRNPWEQAVSFYHHLRKPLYVDSMRGKLIKPVNACKVALESDFPKWVETVYLNRQVQEEASRRPFPVDHFRNQSEWILDPSGRLMVDFVCRFENLENDLKIVQDKIGLAFMDYLPHRNSSIHRHYSEYYDERSMRIIADYFLQDIKLFGYSFGTNIQNQ